VKVSHINSIQPIFDVELLHMLKIGLTGGLGSGKSTVAALFELLAIPVYYADSRAKELMENDAEIISEIKQLFGEESYVHGKLNRNHVAALLFKDPKLTNKINALVHPKTIADANSWLESKKAKGHPFAIKEAALIFESNAQQYLDYVIGVSCPLDLRIQRALKRDNVDQQQIADRISRQMDEDEKMNRCDFILKNDEQELLIPQVVQLHDQLINLSKKKLG
jgi:dephospho-CoA kinase